MEGSHTSVIFKKRNRKRRGQRTHGYGRVGAHRKSGQRGGKGLTTGKFKHKWSYYLKQRALGFPDPRWKIGKRGFTRPQSVTRLEKTTTINVQTVQRLLDSWVARGKASKSGTIYSVDLGELGYSKLLGSGSISKKVEVTVARATERAVQKVEAAKGRVVLTEKRE